jgi:HAD superfamily hydrolase (TIGR01549 family)
MARSRSAAIQPPESVSAIAGVRNPLDPARRIRGVVFDLDGTLYRQTPVRLAMALELLALPLSGLRRAPQRYRALAAYRHAQEALRNGASSVTPASQIRMAADASGLPDDEVAGLVDEWMINRPRKYVAFFRAHGVVELLDVLRARGVQRGLLTDYPPHEKLQALGLADRFSHVACSTDPDIGYFKPHPRGFASFCQRWQLPPDEVLMIGDRVEVDASGAAAAGMPSVIIGARRSAAMPSNCLMLPSFRMLCDVLDGRG